MSYETSSPFIPALPAMLDALPSDTARVPQHQFTRVRQAAFLRRLADCGEVRSAARASGVSHQCVYRMRRACADFARGWDAALLIAREHAEEALATRAMHGTEEQVFYHGEVVATRRRFDSRLLLAHLARLDRLEDRADTAMLAGAFDAVVEAFEHAGGDDAGATGPVLPADLGALTGVYGEGGEKGSGPCHTRSMSRFAEGPEDGDADGDERAPDDAPTSLDTRLDAMEAARPDGVPTAGQAAAGVEEADALEAAQLAAFEAGEARWWEARAEDLSSVDDVELNPGVAAGDQADLLGRGAGQVDLTPAGEGAAIVDTHGDGAAIAGVGDADLGAERQRLVSGGHGVHVEPLSIGGAAAMKPAAVIGRDARAEGADDGILNRRDEDGQINSGRGNAQVGAGAVERFEFVK
ncbi:hypothetical protein MTsPCn3_23920 [Erythrobacter sp. MTPC3]